MNLSRTPQDWGQLVERVRDGDGNAVSQFAEAVGGILFRFFIANGMSCADAEDLSVSCTSDIVMAIGDYKEVERFEAWMFQIARNKRADEFRAKPEFVQLVDNDWLVLYDRERNDSDDRVYQNNGQLSLPVHRALERELSKLPAKDRRLVEGRHASTPMTFIELGSELKLTEGNARVRYLRIKSQLKAALLEDGHIQNWLVVATPTSLASLNPITKDN